MCNLNSAYNFQLKVVMISRSFFFVAEEQLALQIMK